MAKGSARLRRVPELCGSTHHRRLPLYGWRHRGGPLASGHVYSVRSVDREAGTVTLSNPWGPRSPNVTLKAEDLGDNLRKFSYSRVPRATVFEHRTALAESLLENHASRRAGQERHHRLVWSELSNQELETLAARGARMRLGDNPSMSGSFKTLEFDMPASGEHVGDFEFFVRNVLEKAD